MLATELTVLDLGANSIGVEGATAVALMLEGKVKLSALNFRGNKLGDDGKLGLF
jgi:hypothetical protein